VSEAELKLAKQLGEQLAARRFEPSEYAGEQTNVTDLMVALKASLNARETKATDEVSANCRIMLSFMKTTQPASYRRSDSPSPS
jgi:non-homologous end joining protein Ku